MKKLLFSLKKNLILMILSIILILFAGFTYHQQSKIRFLDDKINRLSKKIESSPSPLQVPTPSLIPTPKPTPMPSVLHSSTPSPTPNTAIQDRIKQVDIQIQKLQDQRQTWLDVMNSAVNCTTPICQSVFYSDQATVNSLNNQIQQLQNEKADLQLQLSK